MFSISTFVKLSQQVYPFVDEVVQNSWENHNHLNVINRSMNELI